MEVKMEATLLAILNTHNFHSTAKTWFEKSCLVTFSVWNYVQFYNFVAMTVPKTTLKKTINFTAEI